jgi:hypothetical protein
MEKDPQDPIEEAIAKNNDEWEKRMLLLAMITLIITIGLD